MQTKWTQSKLLKNSPAFTRNDFRETLDGGQAFRWHKQKDDSFIGVFGKHVAHLSLNESGKIHAAFPQSANIKSAEAALLEYLDADRDYKKIIAEQSDPLILNAAAQYPTLRILRQDPKDAIISFICSSSKRIVQIKQCVNLIAEKLGDNICENFNALPDFQTIAAADIQILKDCKLGYRAEYLKKTAQKITADNFDPNSLRDMPYPEAKKYLLTLHGIGEKVADCILLFGAAHFQAFPVDTWISKTMLELYGLQHPKLTRDFATQTFGPNAGYIQQILFASIRAGINK